MSKVIVSHEIGLDAVSIVMALAEQMEADPGALYVLRNDVVRDMVRLRRRVIEDNRRTAG